MYILQITAVQISGCGIGELLIMKVAISTVAYKGHIDFLVAS